MKSFVPETTRQTADSDTGQSLIGEYMLQALNDSELRYSITGWEKPADFDFDLLARDLIDYRTDAILLHLPLVPLPGMGMPEDLVVTALSARNLPVQGLFIPVELYDQNQDLRIKKGSQITVVSEIYGLQLRHLNPDIQFIVTDNPVSEGEKNAVFFSAGEGRFSAPEAEGYVFVPVNLREVMPPAGTGYLAFVTLRENFGIRRTINHLHHSEEVPISNAERKLALLYGQEPVCVHVSKDRSGYFHINVAAVQEGILRKTFFSTSLATQIASMTYERLQKI